MLKTRIITALLLVAVLLPSLFLLPQSLWALLMALIAGLAAWEWGGLLRWPSGKRILYGTALTLLCAGITWANPAEIGRFGRASFLIYAIAAVFWLIIAPLWLRLKWRAAPGGALVGIIVIYPTWLAIVQLRAQDLLLLLAVLALTWLADIAAYLCGRRFGRHKLAPVISPGKTWEGALGAALAVLLYGMLLRQGLGLQTPSPALWVAGILLIFVVSILGDLLESLLKRQAGIKDSSALLPGHGGVLDRIDSLTSSLPLTALLWLLFAGTR